MFICLFLKRGLIQKVCCVFIGYLVLGFVLFFKLGSLPGATGHFLPRKRNFN